jgi:hypothetical protein
MNQREQLRRKTLIASRLFIARVTQGDVARAAHVTRGMVCHVIAGRKRHAGVQAELARVCKMEFSDLWEV